ncbi:MAG TPA: hypothetical protein VGN09_09510 [Vicinamibacteria bacterium]|jgi:lysophospholipase L1-like esterase
MWLGLALTYSPTLRRSLLNRSVPYPGLIVAAGYALWFIALLALGAAHRRRGARADSRVYALAADGLFLAALFVGWLIVFRFGWFAAPLLALHLFGPALVFLCAAATNGSASGLDAALARLRATDRLTGPYLALVALMLFSAAAEAAFTALTGLGPEQRDEYGTRFDFVLSPYVMFAEPDVTRGGRTNRQGFFGPEWPAPKPPGEKRVVMLGGSVVWQGKHYDSIAAHMERALRERYGDSVHVANFGRQSYVSMQELIVLERQALPLQPDLVVVFDGFNDLAMPYGGEPMGVGYPFLYSNLERILETDLTRVAAGHAVRGVKLHSALVSYLARNLESRALETRKGRFDVELAAREYGRNLLQMAALSKFYRARVLLATQPFVGTKDPRTAREDRVYHAEELQMMQDYYRRLAAAAREAASQADASYLDATDVFDGIDRDIFEDQAHFALFGGNPLVGRRLADAVIELGLLR